MKRYTYKATVDYGWSGPLTHYGLLDKLSKRGAVRYGESVARVWRRQGANVISIEAVEISIEAVEVNKNGSLK